MMSYHKKMKQGFSLIELLVVILIVSIIYFLGFEGFSSSEIIKNRQKPLDMLHELINQKQEGKLICIDQCKTCFFKKSLDTKATKMGKEFNLGKDVVIYKLDNYNMLEKVEFGRYEDHKICMIIDFYKNGSHTKFVLKNKSHIYFISSYIEDIQEVKSLDDAKRLWLGDINALHDGDFF